MSELLKDIEKYWTNRAAGYSAFNQNEVALGQKERWGRELFAHLPKGDPKSIRILDAGTGPGFFAILLAEAGYRVTAVDYTEQMLLEARKNAGALADQIEWHQMDVQKLAFPDNSFDAVVSRNVTWNLEYPRRAYEEWNRVLKPGGVLLNSDANWYGYLYDESLEAAYRSDRDRTRELEMEDLSEGEGVDNAEIERIARNIPLSAIQRPMWDLQVMKEIGYAGYEADEQAGERILSEMEKVNYESTPVFMVYGRKKQIPLDKQQ